MRIKAYLYPTPAEERAAAFAEARADELRRAEKARLAAKKRAERAEAKREAARLAAAAAAERLRLAVRAAAERVRANAARARAERAAQAERDRRYANLILEDARRAERAAARNRRAFAYGIFDAVKSDFDSRLAGFLNLGTCTGRSSSSGGIPAASKRASERAGTFVWISHSGDAYRLYEMATTHVFYSLRMLFNHTVPPAFRVGTFKRYKDVPHWSFAYRIQAIRKLAQELRTREVDSVHAAEFEDIRQNAAALRQLGIVDITV